MRLLSLEVENYRNIASASLTPGRELTVICGNNGQGKTNLLEAIWLLTKNGEFRLRGYNQTNDRYFTKSTLTTQGIGIMYKKDFMNWKELVDWFLRRRKNRSSKQKEKEDQKYLPQEALPAAREKRESNEK